MPFLDNNHNENIRNIDRLWDNLRELRDLANEFGIEDIFQDNGAKVLQQLMYLNLANLPGREGNDALDENNIEWEMKSINIGTSASGFSTNHHLNYEILDKYRQVPWSFAIYENIELQEIYVMNPSQLEIYFSKWESKLNGGQTHINNPKIPVKFIRNNGLLVYPINRDEPINPTSIYNNEMELQNV